MSICINPRCSQPDDPANLNNQICHNCGSQLLLQERYQVMRLLSETSGFGKVYEAYQGATPKILKILKQKHNDNPRVVELFKQEAEVLMTLNHPGIPKVEADGYFQFVPRDNSEPLHCLIMEKIDGPNLSQWMQQQGNHPISDRQAIQWLKQLTEVLHLVHQQNYFHRDIKPENIMIRPSGQLVLIDFGAAREMTQTYLEKLEETAGITKISSAGYTPPEQEKGYAIPQSDFYALGRTFVYLLTAKQITDTDIYNPLTDEFTWQIHAPNSSLQLVEFIDKLIASKAIDRPKDTQEILESIESLDFEINNYQSLPIQDSLQRHNQLEPSFSKSTLIQETLNSSPKKIIWSGIFFLILGLGSYGFWQKYQTPYRIKVEETRKLVGHSGSVNDLAFSHDGQKLISASSDKTIKIWNLNTGQLIKSLEGRQGHRSHINEVIITSDSYHLISAGADTEIKIWKLNSHEERNPKTLVEHSNFINALALSIDGKKLISAAKNIRVWELETGTLLSTLSGHENFINAVAVPSDGKTLISADADGMIKVWDLKNKTEILTLKGHHKPINALVLTPEGDRLISASADKTIKIWNLKNQELIQTLKGHKSYVQDLAIKSNGTILVSSSADQTIKFWNLETGKEIYTLKGYPFDIKDFEMSPDWQKLATGSETQEITIWNLDIRQK